MSYLSSRRLWSRSGIRPKTASNRRKNGSQATAIACVPTVWIPVCTTCVSDIYERPMGSVPTPPKGRQHARENDSRYYGGMDASNKKQHSAQHIKCSVQFHVRRCPAAERWLLWASFNICSFVISVQQNLQLVSTAVQRRHTLEQQCQRNRKRRWFFMYPIDLHAVWLTRGRFPIHYKVYGVCWMPSTS